MRVSIRCTRRRVDRVGGRALILSLLLTGISAYRSGTPPCRAQSPAAQMPATQTVPASALGDLDVIVSGKGSKPLHSLFGGRATAVVFLSVACPISNGYSSDLLALADATRRQGGAVILVYSNPEDIPEAPAHAVKYGLNRLPVVLDENQRLADRLHARVTPQAFVLDSAGATRYSGRLDDRYISRGKPTGSAARAKDLANALQAVLSGKPVTIPVTQPFGCVIERRTQALKTGPTYAQNIAPILNRSCVGCHHAGEVGPMSLTTYAQAKRYAANIANVTQTRLMPPWKPSNHGVFAGERRLTEAEISILKQWAQTGAAAGDIALAPAPPTFAPWWILGKPDIVLTMPRPFPIPAGGVDVHRCFVLPASLLQNAQVAAVAYRPGNKRVTRQITGYIDTTGTARQLEMKTRTPGPGYASFGGPGFLPKGELGIWAPGAEARRLPDGVALSLPAGADIVLQIDYHPDGKPEQDQTQIGLYLARKPVSRKLRLISLEPTRLDIPSGDANYIVEHTITLPFAIQALSIRPHMHLLGRSMQVDVTLPDGTRRSLLDISDWDYNSQDAYFYRDPLDLPKGARLRLRATYDNSAANPRQPNRPPRAIMWGRHITDEMCAAYLTYIASDENHPLIRMMDGFPADARPQP